MIEQMIRQARGSPQMGTGAEDVNFQAKGRIGLRGATES